MQVEPREWCFSAVMKVCHDYIKRTNIGLYTDAWWDDLQKAITNFIKDQGLTIISNWHESFYHDETWRARVRSAHLKQSHVALSTYPEYDIITLWLVSCKSLDHETCVECLVRQLEQYNSPATLVYSHLYCLAFDEKLE